MFERVFDAPRDLVWQVYTDPDHIARWWGTHGSTTEVLEMDLRPGGSWHYVSHAPDRGPIGFRATTSRSTRRAGSSGRSPSTCPTSSPGRETMTLEDLGDGRSRLIERGHFGSKDEIESRSASA